MANIYEPNYLCIEEIYIKEIVFEKSVESNEVTLFGCYYNPFAKKFYNVDYGCDFSTFIDLLLLASEEEGDPIIVAITDILSNNDPKNPCTVDIENMFGSPIKIENIILTIYKPMEQNEKGEWQEESDTFYIIEHVEAKNKFEE